MNKEYETAVKKANCLKRIPAVASVCAVVFVILFHKGNQIGTVAFGFLSIPTTVAILIAALALWLVLYRVAVIDTEKILTDECDPLKFLYVFENVFFKKNKPLSLEESAALCTASEATGDHDGANKYAGNLLGTKREFYGLLSMLKTAYINEETERIPELYESFRESVARTGQEKLLAGQIVFAGMLKASAAGETDGTSFAGLLDVEVGKRISMTVRAFFTGLVFYRAGEFEKAKERFEAAVKYGGKTWYSSESEIMLSLIRDRKG